MAAPKVGSSYVEKSEKYSGITVCAKNYLSKITYGSKFINIYLILIVILQIKSFE